MLFSNDRQQLRRFFFETWQKFQAQQGLTALEQQLINAIAAHPEYEYIFNQPEKYLDYDYLPEMGEQNPFLHLSLHMGLIEQITTDRPAGITQIYHDLCHKLTDIHLAEHKMIDCLAQGIWQMQRGNAYSEQDYLNDLHKLLH